MGQQHPCTGWVEILSRWREAWTHAKKWNNLCETRRNNHCVNFDLRTAGASQPCAQFYVKAKFLHEQKRSTLRIRAFKNKYQRKYRGIYIKP